MLKRDKNFIYGVLTVLFCFNILAWLIVYDLSKSHFLEVSFFDVGQGDAIFIETPKRHQILIDGGPDSTILEKLAKEMPFWDRSIDLIILTHPDTDHISGLIEVLKRYKVEKILWTGIVKDSPIYQEWLKSIEKEKAIIFIAQAGQRIKARKVSLNILWPMENLKGKRVKNDDNTSIVAKLNFGLNSFLFTGDISKSVEEELIKKFNLNSDILKIAHHGSKTSTAEEFLKEVSPKIAVISVGANKEVKTPDCDNKKRNKYGHPNCEVLERLKKLGIKILRTDEDSDIKILSNGIRYEVSNFQN